MKILVNKSSHPFKLASETVSMMLRIDKQHTLTELYSQSKKINNKPSLMKNGDFERISNGAFFSFSYQDLIVGSTYYQPEFHSADAKQRTDPVLIEAVERTWEHNPDLHVFSYESGMRIVRIHAGEFLIYPQTNFVNLIEDRESHE